MSMKIFAVVFLLSSTVGFILVKSTIIDGAEYYIQNAGDNLCVVAGQIGERIAETLTTYGNATTSSCQDIPEHQWIIHYKKGSKQFELSSGAVHKMQLENPYVNLTGDFVHYFGNWVSTSRIEDEKNDKPSYLIKVGDSNDCFFSSGLNQSLSQSKCNLTDANQAWNFKLVEESKAPGLNCTSFWECT